MQNVGRSLPATRAFPKLYNAKQRIQVSRGLLPEQLDFYRKNPLSENWRKHVSKDVENFVDQVENPENNKSITDELLPQEKIRLFQNPAKYFSRPHNVPNSVRQQVYFPNFGVTFLRTPHLGPRYAQFLVPLWFGKLDLKSYLKNLYDVDVNHIRSYVIHVKRSRKQSTNRYNQGPWRQQAFKKKMTVELVEPFIWPEEVPESQMNRNLEKDSYWKSVRRQLEAAEQEQAEFKHEPTLNHARSIAQQAKDLLAGKTTWKPTWQQLPQDVRVLQGRSRPDVSLPGSNSTTLSR